MRKAMILVGALAVGAAGCGKGKSGASADTEDAGLYASMARLESGRIAVAYYHRSHRDPGANKSDKVGALLYVTGKVKANGRVDFGDEQRVDGDVREDGMHDVGLWTSLRIASDGLARISYYDKTAGDLKYATQVGARKWEIETVDSPGNVGGWTSLVLENDLPRIAYYDFDNGDLKVAARTPAGWTVMKVDGADTDSGKFARIASDGAGGLGVVYYDATNGDLRYVTGSATGFGAPEVVDAAGDTGRWPSLAYDLGTPLIAYEDHTNHDLRFARRDGGASWTLTTVDPADWVGADTSIAVDPNGAVTIAYMDGLNNDLLSASWSGQSWTVRKVAEAGANGYYNNVILDEDAKPVFGTYSFTGTQFVAMKPE